METLISWDHSLFFAVNGWSSPILDLAFTLLTMLGSAWSLGLCTLFIFALNRSQAKRALVLIFASWLLSGILVQALKHTIDRPRPLVQLGAENVRVLGDKRHEHSFPSGHTQTGFSIACTLSLLYNRRRWLQTLLYALAIGIGLSRIYVGAHFPSDVLAGALIGILVSLLIFYFWRKKDSS